MPESMGFYWRFQMIGFIAWIAFGIAGSLLIRDLRAWRDIRRLQREVDRLRRRLAERPVGTARIDPPGPGDPPARRAIGHPRPLETRTTREVDLRQVHANPGLHRLWVGHVQAITRRDANSAGSPLRHQSPPPRVPPRRITRDVSRRPDRDARRLDGGERAPRERIDGPLAARQRRQVRHPRRARPRPVGDGSPPPPPPRPPRGGARAR